MIIAIEARVISHITIDVLQHITSMLQQSFHLDHKCPFENVLLQQARLELGLGFEPHPKFLPQCEHVLLAQACVNKLRAEDSLK
jgi:hypothetical protein